MNTLKKLRYAAYILLAMLVMTSCDEDNRKAFKLNGAWRGDFGMNYSYVDPWGRSHRFDCYDTRIKFNSDIMYSSHGTAVQKDYYLTGPYEYIYYNIDWTINNGVIRLRYHWANQWDTDIFNYSLTASTFRGYFDNTTVPFELHSLTNYDWTIRNSYYDRYGYGCDPYSNYGYYPYPYYAPGKKGETIQGKKRESVDADSTAYIPALEEMHFGNRFTEKPAEE